MQKQNTKVNATNQAISSSSNKPRSRRSPRPNANRRDNSKSTSKVHPIPKVDPHAKALEELAKLVSSEAEVPEVVKSAVPKAKYLYECKPDTNGDKRFGTYAINLHKTEHDLIDFCEMSKIHFEISLPTCPQRSTHPMDAIIREHVFGKWLYALAQKNRNAVILDYYGSVRTPAIVARVNELLHTSIKTTVQRPHVVPEDVFRNVDAHAVSEAVTHVVYVDIYAPEQQFLDEYLNLPTYVFYHDHVGLAGKQGKHGFWIEHPFGSDHIEGYSEGDSVLTYDHQRAWFRTPELFTSRFVSRYDTYCVSQIIPGKSSQKRKPTSASMVLSPLQQWWAYLKGINLPSVIWYDQEIVSTLIVQQQTKLHNDPQSYVSASHALKLAMEKKYGFMQRHFGEEYVLLNQSCLFAFWYHSSMWNAFRLAVFPNMQFNWLNHLAKFLHWKKLLTLVSLWQFPFMTLCALALKWFYSYCKRELPKALEYDPEHPRSHYFAVWKGGKKLRSIRAQLEPKELKPMSLVTVPKYLTTDPKTGWYQSPDDSVKGEKHYYILWGFCVPWKQYAETENNELAAFRRLMYAPLLTPTEQAHAWRQHTRVPLLQILGDIKAEQPPYVEFDFEQTLQWANSKEDPDQKRLYVRTLNKDGVIPDVAYYPIPVMVKKDERHLKPPRPIGDVGPECVVATGPAVEEATKRFKLLFNENRPRITKSFTDVRLQYTLTYAPGLTDRKLGEWATTVVSRQEPGFDILAAGDDSVVKITKPDGTCVYFCSDFTNFDGSQSYAELSNCPPYYRPPHLEGDPSGARYICGPIAAALTLLYTILDGDTDTIQILLTNINRDLKMKLRTATTSDASIVYDSMAWPIMPTGISCTTWVNTMSNFVATMTTVIRCFRTDNFDKSFLEDSFNQLGFKSKIKMCERLSQTDFLKGHFLPYKDSENWRWAPGLGVITKFGYSSKDVRTLYKTPDAEVKYLSDVATGYASFVHVPILRAFIRRFNSPSGKRVEENPYWVSGTTGESSELFDLTDYLSYYQVSTKEIKQIEWYLSRLPLGYVLDWPALERLYQDYL